MHNIIYIHTHDMGRHIGPYGCGFSTPAMERFAERSAVFRNAFCCAPTCSPSRAALLTGMTPHQSGMLGLAHRGFSLEDPEKHLCNVLKAEGYETALFGIQHEFNWKPETIPYHIVETGSSAPDRKKRDEHVTDQACRFLRRKHDSPVFLSFGLYYPHRKFLKAEAGDSDIHCAPPAPLPDHPLTRGDMADYACSVRFADGCIGRVLSVIEAEGYLDNSVVILTTDHGIAFPGMKCNLRDQGIGVTLMLHYPNNPASGKFIDSLVSHLDVFPTLCELTGLSKPSHLQGVSLLPLISGTRKEVREEVFSEVTFHAAYQPMRSIRTHRYKFIRRWTPLHYPLANCDSSPSKTLMRSMGWPKDPLPATELYDLLEDPFELRNLSGSKPFSEIEADLGARLEAWMLETSDPLQHGTVPRPCDAIINRNSSEEPGHKDYESD